MGSRFGWFERMKHSTAIVFALLAVVSCGDTHDGIDVADDRDALSLWDAAQGFQEWKRAHDGPQTRVYVEVPGVLESPQRSDEAIAGSHVVVTSSTIDSGDAIGVYEFIDEEVG